MTHIIKMYEWSSSLQGDCSLVVHLEGFHRWIKYQAYIDMWCHVTKRYRDSYLEMLFHVKNWKLFLKKGPFRVYCEGWLDCWQGSNLKDSKRQGDGDIPEGSSSKNRIEFSKLRQCLEAEQSILIKMPRYGSKGHETKLGRLMRPGVRQFLVLKSRGSSWGSARCESCPWETPVTAEMELVSTESDLEARRFFIISFL